MREDLLEKFTGRQWLSRDTLATDDLGSKPGPASSKPCDLEQATLLLCASVSPSVERVNSNTSLLGLGGSHVLVCAKCLEQSEECPQALFQVTGELIQAREAEGEGEAANNCTWHELGLSQGTRGHGVIPALTTPRRQLG